MGVAMTEEELSQCIFIWKEIEVLNKELIKLKSDQIIQVQGFTEKLYLGEIIDKTAEELKEKISEIENGIKLKLHELIDKRIKVEDYINSIEDCEIRLILRLRYINCLTYAEIAAELKTIDESGNSLKGVKSGTLSTKVDKFFKRII